MADSDEELIDTLSFLAAHIGGAQGERLVQPHAPILDLALPDGSGRPPGRGVAPPVGDDPQEPAGQPRPRLRDLGMLDDAVAAF